MNMVDELLPTEADLRYFCKQNGLQSSSIAIMAIEAYKVLSQQCVLFSQMIKYLTKLDNTETRKRQNEDQIQTISASKQPRMDLNTGTSQQPIIKPKRKILPKPTTSSIGGLSELLLGSSTPIRSSPVRAVLLDKSLGKSDE